MGYHCEYILVIIIRNHHELGLNGPVLASSRSLFGGHPSFLHPISFVIYLFIC